MSRPQCKLKNSKMGYESSEFYQAWYGPCQDVPESHNRRKKERTELLRNNAPSDDHVRVFEILLNGGMLGDKLLGESGLTTDQLDKILLWLTDESLHGELDAVSTERFYVWGYDHNEHSS